MPGRCPSPETIFDEAGLHLDERVGPGGSPEFHISGDTHPYRHLLRDAGGEWDKLKRVWKFSDADPTPGIAELLARRNDRGQGLAESKTEKPHYWGHRDRLRARFLNDAPECLADYELLELILFQCISRIDVKPIAKRLIENHGSLGAVLAAEPENLAEIEELSYGGIVHLKALGELTHRTAREEVAAAPVLSSWDKLVAYLRARLAHRKKECFQVLFLNAKNMLIADEVQQTGTVDHTPAYPREVIKRALDLGATALILVHNHPSGDPTPSRADIHMTKEIAEAGERLGITLHDHVIVSKHGHASFRDMGLL